MKNTTSDLPSKLQPFASLLDAQPPEVQAAFQFLPATAMHEAGKFEVLNVAEVNGRWHHTFSGTGERCTAWCDQELDYRPPYPDDEPVRLALSVDL